MILYIILFILAIHYSAPTSVVWFCAFGMCWEIVKAIGRGIKSLMEEQQK